MPSAVVTREAMPLTLLPPPNTREDVLARQLDRVGARARRVVFLRNGSWLLVVAFLFVAAVGYLDHRFQLPSLVRALGLVSFLVAIPVLFRRWLVKPLAGSQDPVQVALQVERAYPELNDVLVSA